MSDSSFILPPEPPEPVIHGFPPALPMTFGQILDRIFKLVRGHFWPFTAIGAFPFGVVLVFEAVIFGGLFLAGVFKHPPAFPDVATIRWILGAVGLLFIPIMLVMYGLYYGAASYAALVADHGFEVTAGEAFRHAWSKLGRYVWLMFLRGLIIGAPIVVCVLVFAIGVGLFGLLSKGNENPVALFLLIPLGILLYFGAIVYAILMTLRLSLAFPACVNESLTAGQALKRSGLLTQGAKGRIFLVLLVIYAISYAFVMVLYAVGLLLFAVGALIFAGHFDPSSPLTIVLAVVAGIVLLTLILFWTATLMAAYSSAFAVIYRDQCVRRDGAPPAHISVQA
ncbi:MAG: hypothetical protein ABSG96_19630 [Terracidiphilus sp.]|jgi:hypothetical protein